MSEEEISLIKEMYANAILASTGKGEYQDPKAKEKAKVLEKILDMLDKDEDELCEDKDYYIYKTTSPRNFRLGLEGWRMACSLYDILSWSRAIYNGKDYGKGSVIYRNKIYDKEEWERMTNSFNENREIEYDFMKKTYIDSEGEVPSSEVFFVYTDDQIVEEIDRLTSGISEFIYNFME